MTIGADKTDEVRLYDGHNAHSGSNEIATYSKTDSISSPDIESTGSSMYITLWKSATQHEIAIYLEFEVLGEYIEYTFHVILCYFVIFPCIYFQIISVKPFNA